MPYTFSMNSGEDGLSDYLVWSVGRWWTVKEKKANVAVQALGCCYSILGRICAICLRAAQMNTIIRAKAFRLLEDLEVTNWGKPRSDAKFDPKIGIHDDLYTPWERDLHEVLTAVLADEAS